MSEEHKATLEDEIGLLEDLLDRCRDSQGYGGFSWRDPGTGATFYVYRTDKTVICAGDYAAVDK